MKSNDLRKSKKRKAERRRGKERREGGRRGEERTEEKESSQPSTSSLTILIKLHFFLINKVLYLVSTTNILHERRIIQ